MNTERECEKHVRINVSAPQTNRLQPFGMFTTMQSELNNPCRTKQIDRECFIIDNVCKRQHVLNWMKWLTIGDFSSSFSIVCANNNIFYVCGACVFTMMASDISICRALVSNDKIWLERFRAACVKQNNVKMLLENRKWRDKERRSEKETK